MSTKLITGKLYKKVGRDEVYYFDQDTLRYVQSIDTLNGVFDGVLQESPTIDALIDGAPKGDPIVPGSYLAKSEISDTVYFIDSLGGAVKKRAISTSPVFEARSFKWSTIMTVPWLTLGAIPDGPAITIGYDDNGNPIT
ncbi:hypothetical protein HZU83_12685 [Sphaerotilus montanus]|uniref:Uncharacterized protein n=1 Tax=Sphaerotilus montanus TaxID=522889 RepID=A0A7Y9QZE7_9BURK|nr:hypothetical protein [Sphaerotilus montanus]NYG32390.1 hypothetical protein [Sphaerotilus montanus]NZD57546.1 hypothetical protein [Sphaerotilus montanus]